MSQENVESVPRLSCLTGVGRSAMVGFGVTRPGRAQLLMAVVVALACALALSAPAGAAPAAPFREVAVVKGARYVKSDGVRFAWTANQWGETNGVVRVFDTLRGRNFRLAAPTPGCGFISIGGGLAVWRCAPPAAVLLTNLSTGQYREAAGVDQICGPLDNAYEPLIGRYWLTFGCGESSGSWSGPYYLNHRTGELVDPPRRPTYVDLDYRGLMRPVCAPLIPDEFGPYAPPFALEFYRPGHSLPAGNYAVGLDLRLRRCGRERAERLSRCLVRCWSVQLASRYVTWANGESVAAYLPRTRQRVRFQRPREAFARWRLTAVAHTCNRVFALWGNTIYAARFEPARGAPPCQSSR
jgi:hypothetical protein